MFQAAKNDSAHFSAIFVVFNLPEVNMIGSRVTVDTPRERKQLEAFGKMSGLSSRLFLSFPAPPLLPLIFSHLCPRALARLPLA